MMWMTGPIREHGPEGFDDMIAEKCEDCPLGRLQI